MAITNNGTKVSVPTSKLPDGYTLPSVTEVTDWDYKDELELDVDRATVYSATKTTTMTNILGNASIGITKQIDDILSNDFVSTNTVTAYADLWDISTNLGVSPDTDLYGNTDDKFVCKVRLYVKVA